MAKWSRNRRYASYLKSMNRHNVEDVEFFMRSLKTPVAYDEAAAACAVKDLVYGMFKNVLMHKLQKTQKEVEKLFTECLKAKNAEEREKILPRHALQDAVNFLLSKCDLIWQIDGLPADFARCLPMPDNLYEWMDPRLWANAILEYFHPSCMRSVPLARRAWEEKMFGKNICGK